MDTEWVAATPEALWLKRRVRIKSEEMEGVVAGPPLQNGRCAVRVEGNGTTLYVEVWDLQVRRGRN